MNESYIIYCLILLFLLFIVGETYFHLQNIQEAEYWYKKSLESKPDHVPAHLTYSNLLSKTVSKETLHTIGI